VQDQQTLTPHACSLEALLVYCNHEFKYSYSLGVASRLPREGDYSLLPVLFAHLELSVKTKAAAKMTLLPLYKSDCAEAEGILRIDWKHRLLF